MSRPSPPPSLESEEALARACLERLDLEGARRHAGRALAVADPRTALWLIYQYLQDYEGVLARGSPLLAAAPADLGVLRHMGRASYMLGRRSDALAFFARLAEHAPERPDVVYALAELLLLAGDAEAGWRRLDSLATPALIAGIDPQVAADPVRYWRGQSLAGKRILVVNYLGIGDNLMMARYARDLKAQGAYVAFASRPELYRLLAGLAGVDELWSGYLQAPWTKFDYWTFDYLAPRFLGAAQNQIPAYLGGYVARPPAQEPARRPGRLRVGLCATTGLDHFTGVARFLRPEDLKPLADLAHIDWVWVQTARREEAFAARSGLDIAAGPAADADFQDTARIMAGLDLVISIDSAPLHLAGALGLPVWGLICAAPDWKWGASGVASPWYPNLTLYRQTRLGDWSDAVAEVRADLAAYVPPGAGHSK